MLDIKIVFFSIIDFLEAVMIVFKPIVNKLINCSIIPNGQDEYFWLRYLLKDLIWTRVLRDKLDEISKSKLNALL